MISILLEISLGAGFFSSVLPRFIVLSVSSRFIPSVTS